MRRKNPASRNDVKMNDPVLSLVTKGSGGRKPRGFPLPHHRTYGPVYGGSSSTIEMAVQSNEERQTEVHEEGGAISIVHVAGPGIPPGAGAVEGRLPFPPRIEPTLHQALARVRGRFHGRQRPALGSDEYRQRCGAGLRARPSTSSQAGEQERARFAVHAADALGQQEAVHDGPEQLL